MRPAPVNAKPFFRPEAENYRRLRHLGEIELFRSLPLRMIALVPLLFAALLAVAAMSLRVSPQVDLTTGAAALDGGAIGMTLGPGNSAFFASGETVELIAGTDRHGQPARVLDANPIACPQARASASPTCLRLNVRPLPRPGHAAPLVGAITSVRAAPHRYFAFAR